LSPSPDTASIVPLPPVAEALAKAVPRTVITSFLSLVCTVAIALPA
jgi:ABC-type dipeptide/oligopeptide/nickel transport system permease component